MVRLYLILFILVVQLNCHAQILKRIIVDSTTTFSTFPGALTTFKGKLVFTAYTKALGIELYTLDSGDTMAKLVHDINPGKNGSGYNYNQNRMAVLNEVLYFWGFNDAYGVELYSWDGIDTPKMEYEFNPGTGSGKGSNEIITFKDKIIVSATDGTTGAELWAYDPKNKSAQRLTDLNPGSGSSSPANFTAYDEKLYFLAYTPALYTQLFVYNPGTNNTTLVSNLYPSINFNDFKDANGLTVIDDILYITAKSAAYRRELYHIKDNILERLTDINTATIGNLGSSFNFLSLTKVGNTIYMPVTPTDTTVALYTYDPATKTASFEYSGDVKIANGIEYAGALFCSGYSLTTGREVFRYDSVKPYNIADILPGHSFNPDNAANMYVHNNRLYFTASGPDIPMNLHLYEYTDTNLVKAPPPPPSSIKNTATSSKAIAYPNPCISELTIELTLKNDQDYSVRLTDIKGRIVYKTTQRKFTQKERIVIPLQDLSAGAYFYSIVNVNGDFLLGGKILKE